MAKLKKVTLDPEAAETVQTMNVPAVDLPRLVRQFDYAKPPEDCSSCGGEAEWSGNSGIAVCYFCGNRFRSKLFLPNAKECDIPEFLLEEKGPSIEAFADRVMEAATSSPVRPFYS